MHPASWAGDDTDAVLAPNGALRGWLAGLLAALSVEGGADSAAAPPEALSAYVAAHACPTAPPAAAAEDDRETFASWQEAKRGSRRRTA